MIMELNKDKHSDEPEEQAGLFELIVEAVAKRLVLFVILLLLLPVFRLIAYLFGI